MKTVIYVGKYERQFSQDLLLKPKAMLEIGDLPILWHIMKHYASYGFKDFILLCSYKPYAVKEFFFNYSLHHCDVTIDLKNRVFTPLKNDTEDFKVTIIDVGKNTNTGGALKKAQEIIGNEPFMFTYGDGLSDIDLNLLLSHHLRHKKMITISAISASQKYGMIDFNDNGSVIGFKEKEMTDSIVNGGFMVCNSDVFDLIDDDPSTIFEKEPMVTAVACHQVTAYHHHGFWRAVDNYEDLDELNKLYESNKAPWNCY